MRLIDADFMKKSIRLTPYANKADKAMVEDIKQWIDNQPTVEPLKEQETIVRCKDCRHWNEEYGQNCMIKQGWFPVKPDWFCADGERK